MVHVYVSVGNQTGHSLSELLARMARNVLVVPGGVGSAHRLWSRSRVRCKPDRRWCEGFSVHSVSGHATSMAHKEWGSLVQPKNSLSRALNYSAACLLVNTETGHLMLWWRMCEPSQELGGEGGIKR